MSSILRRPMFRMGGSANSKGTGITSGLERKGYAEAGSVSSSVDVGELGRQFEELQKIKEQYGIKPPEAPEVKLGLSDYLDIIGTGFRIAGKPGVSTLEAIGEEAPGTLTRIGERLQTKEQKRKDVETQTAAMKAGDIESIYEQLGKEAIKRAETDEKGFALEKKIEMIGTLTTDINELTTQLGDPSLDDKQKTEINRQIKVKEAQLATLTEKDPVLDAFFRSDEGSYLFGDIAEMVQDTINPATGENWSVNDPGYYREVMRVAKEAVKGSFKKGGRVGMQVGGMTPAPVPGSMPPEQQTADVQSLSYDDLRARLPKEITNDIVQLISASEQALSEFANIRTQADVDNFNKKYNVNLVLPQEA
jgi:hypothetical protein